MVTRPRVQVMIPAFCNIPASLLNLVRLPALKEIEGAISFQSLARWRVAQVSLLRPGAPGDIAVTQRVVRRAAVGEAST
jgi:hypothetical protein